ncbi:hypothetical protein FZX09_03975 [Synechococcus sp. MU1643]|uniref:hypothetical protein n=1 Tax=Synechococcus sp. MU1643 TaxID=2508349 RepID=UPI001CF921A7|nr:hypothetical protein [Synechococcus sp. MU1643]MCB4427971.1 hypothetical protein [Synechococcus sp. MU1643]
MPEYVPTAADVAEWSGGGSEEQAVDLQAQAEQQSQRSFDRAQENLTYRHSGAGFLDPLDHSDHQLHKFLKARNEAEDRGDYHEAQRLEAMLDAFVAGDVPIVQDKKAPATPKASTPAQEEPKAQEVVEEQPQQRFTDLPAAVDVNNAMGGADKADEVISYINENYSDDEARTVLKALQSDNSDDAIIAMTVAKTRMEQAAKGNVQTKMGFDDAYAKQLGERYGAKADAVVDLSNKVASGELTQAAAMAQAMKDPQLLATAQQMLSDGSITLA